MEKPKLGRKPGSKSNLEGLASFKSATREELSALYESGKTTREIGEVWGVSRTAVDNQFKRLGIARRWHDETGKWKNAKLSVGLSFSQEQLLLGSILGDACLHRQPFRRVGGQMAYYGKVTFAHGAAQLGYLEFKRALLLQGREHLPKPCVSKISARPEGSNLGKQMFQFSFSHDPTVRAFEEKFNIRDQQDRIMVSRKWADSIGPEAFSYWFLDDGHLRTKSTNGHSRFQLSTNAYDSCELELLLEVVHRLGGPSAKLRQAREGQFIIVVNRREEVEALGRLMSTYTPACMKHKLKDLI